MKSWTVRVLVLAALLVCAGSLYAQGETKPAEARSEANLVLPDLHQVTFLGGITGHKLLICGLFVCVLGLLFGLVMYTQLKNLPVHRSMREISELIYETCKTYLHHAGQVHPAASWLFIGAIMVVYFGVLRHFDAAARGDHHHRLSLVGIAGSYGVAWFGIRINTFANSRTAFASLRGKPFPTYDIPLKAGMSIGMLLISIELVMMLLILLFVPRRLRRPVLHRLRHR